MNRSLLAVLLLVVAVLCGLACSARSHGPAVSETVLSERAGYVMQGSEIRHTNDLVVKSQDASGNVWTDSRTEVLDPVAGGLPALEQQLFLKASKLSQAQDAQSTAK